MANKRLPVFYVEIVVEPTSYTYLLNTFASKGIVMYGIKRQNGKKLQFIVAQKDISKTFAILDKMCYNYYVAKKWLVADMLKYTLTKLGLIITSIVFAISYMLSYGYVWRIDITGTDTIEKKVLYDLLQDNGISAYIKKSSVDTLAVETIINSNESILLSSATIIGTSLVISVTEKTEHLELPQGEYSDIVSQYDATITKIVCKSGTTAVTLGQHVFKNATLISASKETASGESKEVLACGTVYGTVTTTIVNDINLLSTMRVDTGRSYKEYSYMVFGNEVFGEAKNPYNYYRAETSTEYLSKNMLLPFMVKTTTYYEQEEQEYILDIDTQVDNLIAENMLSHIYSTNATNYTVVTELKQTADYTYKLYIYLQAEIVIGQG